MEPLAIHRLSPDFGRATLGLIRRARALPGRFRARIGRRLRTTVRASRTRPPPRHRGLAPSRLESELRSARRSGDARESLGRAVGHSRVRYVGPLAGEEAWRYRELIWAAEAPLVSC